jgi:CRP-like cAMP-binding protein
MLATQQVKEMLGHVDLFRGCSEPVLAGIATLATEHDYQMGDVIYDTSDKATDVYILVNGIVTFINKSGLVFINNLTPIQQVVERSMVFGWAALVPQYPKRLGRAQALEKSKILSINGKNLLDILDQNPECGYLVMKRLCSLIASTFVEKT